MRQRPIRQLVDLLRNLGARIDYVLEDGFPPINVLADGLAGGLIRFGSAQSSQYLSAVLQSRPLCPARGAGRSGRPADELALRRDDRCA